MHPLRAGESLRTSRNPSICQAQPVGGVLGGKKEPLTPEFASRAPPPPKPVLPPLAQAGACGPCSSFVSPLGFPQDVVLACVTVQSPVLPELSLMLPVASTVAPSASAHWLMRPLIRALSAVPPHPSPVPTCANLCQPAPSGPAVLKPTESFYTSLLLPCGPSRSGFLVWSFLSPKTQPASAFALKSCDHAVYMATVAVGWGPLFSPAEAVSSNPPPSSSGPSAVSGRSQACEKYLQNEKINTFAKLPYNLGPLTQQTSMLGSWQRSRAISLGTPRIIKKKRSRL